MAYCFECGTKLEASDKFCSQCGTPVRAYQTPESEVQPVNAMPEVPVMPAEPVAPMVPYAPAEPATPTVPVKAKVFGFVGMGLSIAGLVFSCIGMLYTLLGMGLEGLGLLFAIIYAVIATPFAVAGLVLSKKAKGLGFKGAAATVGVGLGIASCALIGLSLMLGVLGLA